MPMKNSSTLSLPRRRRLVKNTCESRTIQGGTSRVKESTVDFLRQFARAYNPLPLANASLSGIVVVLWPIS